MARKTKRNAEQEIVLNVLSNSPTQAQVDLLQLFYKGALENTIALMEAMNMETGKAELLLVGMVYKDGSFDAYPLASVLSPDSLGKYLAPDGRGAYESAITAG